MPTLEGAENLTGNGTIGRDKDREQQYTDGSINDAAILLLARTYAQASYACK